MDAARQPQQPAPLDKIDQTLANTPGISYKSVWIGLELGPLGLFSVKSKLTYDRLSDCRRGRS